MATAQNVNDLLKIGDRTNIYTTRLVTAAMENNAKKVSALLDLGADPEIRTVEKVPRTALEYAIRYDCHDVVAILA